MVSFDEWLDELRISSLIKMNPREKLDKNGKKICFVFI